jgi:hypothetical protein
MKLGRLALLDTFTTGESIDENDVFLVIKPKDLDKMVLILKFLDDGIMLTAPADLLKLLSVI